MNIFWIPILLAACSWIFCGCGSFRPAMPPLASIEGVRGHFAEGRIIDLEKEKSISFDELMNDLEGMELIFVGEVHDNPEHHLIEVQILQALMARNEGLTVAMEFFDVTQQPVMDRYLEGGLSETAFLKDVGWAGGWSFPYHFYRALIFPARERGIRLIGINLPAKVVRKVARSGLESLTPEEKAYTAREIDLNNEAHRAYLHEVYKDHPHDDLDNFDYFYQAQCVWEETMAENIARDLKENPGKMVVFTGNSHIVNRFGIPERVLRRIQVKTATVVLYPLTERSILFKNMADYVWLTAACSAGKYGRHTMRLRKPGENNNNEINAGKNR